MENIRKEITDILQKRVVNVEVGVNSIDNDFLREENKGFCRGLHEAIYTINEIFNKYEESKTKNP